MTSAVKVRGWALTFIDMSDNTPDEVPDISTETFDEPDLAEPPPRPAEPQPPPMSARTELPFGLVLFLLLALLVVLFTVQNTQDVELNFLTWEGRYPLALIIIGTILVTVILDEILGLFLRRRRRRRAAERAELKRLREQSR